VDTQTIGVGTAVISATVAAQALLLNWYRDQHPGRPRLFAAAAVAVAALGTVGTALVFLSGAPQPESGSTDTSVARLTAAQYRQEAGSGCSRVKEVLDRIKAARPRRSPFSVVAQIEETALRELQRLEPPLPFDTSHRDAVALWTRRVTLIHRLDRGGDRHERTVAAAEVNRLAKPLNWQLRQLGLTECLF